MHLAILMTNTDDSSFADRHPDDGEKFTALLHRVRPQWKTDVFFVKDDVFPSDLNFDGLLITGSPASVHDEGAWIGRLETLIKEAATKKIPMFGACFGHQIIAKALGATVAYNRDGWALGRVETTFLDTGKNIPIYAAHKEQVTTLPPNARITAQTAGCDIAGFAIDDFILTTQYHPEMTRDFIAALLNAFETEIGEEITKSAKDSLMDGTDIDGLAEWIAQFFEQATTVPNTGLHS